MNFNDFLKQPASKKIAIVEIDTPLYFTWNNYQSGIWFAYVPAAKQTDTDDYGNIAYIGNDDSQYYNFQSVNVNGELYSEVASLSLCISTNKSWFYDTANEKIYIHFESFEPPCVYAVIAPGAAIGFTNQIDQTTNNYFEDIYYEPLITGIPNFTKKKDSLFFGLIQYQGGSISFDNTGGYFDNFATRDLYGQPVRIKLSFEGLDYSDSLLVYSGRVEDFIHDFKTFKLNVIDIRKLLSRKLPINVFNTTDYPSMDNKLIGIPIPLIYGPGVKVPAYKTSSGHWKFADTTYNNIDSGITVYNKKTEATFSHSGTGADGTFTGADTDDKLYVTCSQSTKKNGLDIITDLLETYEGIDYNSSNYDTTEWETEKAGVMDEGIWIGKGNLKTSADIIEQICTDNQGIFDVLADGRFTYRSYNPDRTPSIEIFEDELLDDPSIKYDSEEFLSSVKVEYSKDWLEKESEIFTNDDYESEVYGRYRQYKERTFETALTSETDAETLTDSIMEISKFIYPIIGLTTKTQNIGMRILDNILYTFARQNGNEILARSRFQVLGVQLDLTNYKMGITIKQIESDDNIYHIFDGGDSTTDYDYYDGGE